MSWNHLKVTTSQPEMMSLGEIRRRLADWILIAAAVAITVLLPTMLIRARYTHTPVTLDFPAIASPVLWTAVLVRHRLNTDMKVCLVLAGLLTAGIAGLILYGIMGSALLGLSLACVLATVFFGLRAGLICLGLCTAYSLAVALAVGRGLITYKFDLAEYVHQPSTWVHVVLSMAVQVGITIIALSTLQRSLYRLLRSADSSRAELEQANAALQESERKYRSIFEHAPVTIFQSSPEGRLLDTNPAGVRMFRYQSLEEMLAATADVAKATFVHPEKRREIISRIQEADGFLRFENRYRRKDGTVFYANLYMRAVRKDGEVAFVEGFVEDITEREAALVALRESEERYRTLVDGAPDAIFVQADGRFVYVNPEAVKLFGAISEDDLLYKPVIDQMHPDFRQRVAERIRLLNEEKKPVPRLEQKYLQLDGAEIDVEVSAVPVTYMGRNGAVVFVRNITERKHSERSLLESEEKYRELVQNANSIILRWDLSGTLRFFNEFAQAFFGYSQSEAVGRNVIGTIVPETDTSGTDLIALMEEICKHPERHRTNVNENMRKNGERVWIAWTNKIITDESGEVTGILSVGVDITERKKAEEALIESEQRFQTVFDQASVGIATISPDGHFLQVNPKIIEITGLSADELIGHHYAEITHPEDRLIGRQDVEDMIAGTASSAYLQKRYIHKDGSTLWATLYLAMVRDTQDRPSYFIAIIEDITRIKQTDEEKRLFYRETISSVTDGRLLIVSAEEIRPYHASAERYMPIDDFGISSVVRHEMEEYCREKGLTGDRLSLFVTGLGEAMTNAIKHAGSGTAFAGAGDGKVWIGVTDKGHGISTLTLPKATLKRGFSTKVSMGMGYSIMLDVADEVLLCTGPDGTTVVLVKNVGDEIPMLSLDDLADTWDCIDID